nr:altronate dehydratase family protein [Cypionkella sp.]
MPTSIRLHADDNVDIALTDLLPGAEALGVTLTERVARGHKLANRAILRGENIRRYGQIIGAATQDIPAGAHVHVHNIAMSDHAQDYAFASEARPLPPATEARSFMGFRRPDGKAGTRNYLGVLTSVNCSGSVARFIAEAAEKDPVLSALPNVDGLVPIVHQTGCGMSGTNEGYQTLMRTLKGYARNANFGGILLVGLGCEVMQVPDLVGQGRLRPDGNFRYMTIQ